MTNLELAQEHEIKKLQEKVALMKQLATTEGFYKYYFQKLNSFKFNYECFNYINNLYFQLFGVERYKSWESFRQSLNNPNLKS